MTIETPRQMIEHLVSGLSDAMPGAPMLEKAAHQAVLPTHLGVSIQQDCAAYGLLERSLTPRDQARAVLSAMASSLFPFWDGYTALKDRAQLERGEVLPHELPLDRLMAAHAFSLAAAVHPLLIAPWVGVVQPADRFSGEGADRRVAAVHLRITDRSLEGIDLHAVRTSLPLLGNRFAMRFAMASCRTDLAGRSDAEIAALTLLESATTVARELNRVTLSGLVANASVAESPESAETLLFRQAYGVPTMRFMGPTAAKLIFAGGEQQALSEPFPGLTRISDMLTETFVVEDWVETFPRTVLLVRARPWELEAPLAYLPWLWTVKTEQVGPTGTDEELIQHTIHHYAAMQVVESRLLARVDLK
jgi:hypothetical protein